MESVILEEAYDENYEPTQEEIIEYAEFLGINAKTEQHLLWIAREGLRAPLPSEWKPCQTQDGSVYYFNFTTGESIWDHPCDEYYKKLCAKEREKAKEKEKLATQPLSAGSQQVKAINDKFAKENKPPSENKSSGHQADPRIIAAKTVELGPVKAPLHLADLKVYKTMERPPILDDIPGRSNVIATKDTALTVSKEDTFKILTEKLKEMNATASANHIGTEKPPISEPKPIPKRVSFDLPLLEITNNKIVENSSTEESSRHAKASPETNAVTNPSPIGSNGSKASDIDNFSVHKSEISAKIAENLESFRSDELLKLEKEKQAIRLKLAAELKEFEMQESEKLKKDISRKIREEAIEFEKTERSRMLEEKGKKFIEEIEIKHEADITELKKKYQEALEVWKAKLQDQEKTMEEQFNIVKETWTKKIALAEEEFLRRENEVKTRLQSLDKMEKEIDEISRLRSEVEQLKKTNQSFLKQQCHIEDLPNVKESEPDKFVEEAKLNIENIKRQNRIYKERLTELVNQSTDFHSEVSRVPATENVNIPTKSENINKDLDGPPHLELEGDRLSLKDLNEEVEIAHIKACSILQDDGASFSNESDYDEENAMLGPLNDSILQRKLRREEKRLLKAKQFLEKQRQGVKDRKNDLLRAKSQLEEDMTGAKTLPGSDTTLLKTIRSGLLKEQDKIRETENELNNSQRLLEDSENRLWQLKQSLGHDEFFHSVNDHDDTKIGEIEDELTHLLCKIHSMKRPTRNKSVKSRSSSYLPRTSSHQTHPSHSDSYPVIYALQSSPTRSQGSQFRSIKRHNSDSHLNNSYFRFDPSVQSLPSASHHHPHQVPPPHAILQSTRNEYRPLSRPQLCTSLHMGHNAPALYSSPTVPVDLSSLEQNCKSTEQKLMEHSNWLKQFVNNMS